MTISTAIVRRGLTAAFVGTLVLATAASAQDNRRIRTFDAEAAGDAAKLDQLRLQGLVDGAGVVINDDLMTPKALRPCGSETDGSGGRIPPSGTSGTSTYTLNAPAGTVEDLGLYLTLTHTFMGDLDITLTSPSGTVVQVWDQQCGASNNLDGVFDDTGAAPGSSCGPTSGVIRPSNAPMSNFDGEPLAGIWTLRIFDRFGGDSGNLSAWSICNAAATSTGDCDLTPVLNALSLLEAKVDVDIPARFSSLDAGQAQILSELSALSGQVGGLQANLCEIIRLLHTPQGQRTHSSPECGDHSWNDGAGGE